MWQEWYEQALAAFANSQGRLSRWLFGDLNEARVCLIEERLYELRRGELPNGEVAEGYEHEGGALPALDHAVSIGIDTETEPSNAPDTAAPADEAAKASPPRGKPARGKGKSRAVRPTRLPPPSAGGWPSHPVELEAADGAAAPPRPGLLGRLSRYAGYERAARAPRGPPTADNFYDVEGGGEEGEGELSDDEGEVPLAPRAAATGLTGEEADAGGDISSDGSLRKSKKGRRRRRRRRAPPNVWPPVLAPPRAADESSDEDGSDGSGAEGEEEDSEPEEALEPLPYRREEMPWCGSERRLHLAPWRIGLA